MSFSSKAKEELSNVNSWSKKDLVKRELIGYFISSNTINFKNKMRYSTQNEYNINRFCKLLKNCNILDYKISINGKKYIIELKLSDINLCGINVNDIVLENLVNEENLDKALVRGAFLGSGYVNDPEKKYHLEINFSNIRYLEYVKKILIKYNINMKMIEKSNKCSLYLKEGEEISNFLAFIGANKAVLEFEETRVIRDTRNNVNRLINCETANISKIVEASMKQVNDIKYIKAKNKFGELPDNLKEIANIRLAHPDASLSELVNIMENTISKSGISHRLAAIAKFAQELSNV